MKILTAIIVLGLAGVACAHRHCGAPAPSAGAAVTLPVRPDSGEVVMRSFAGTLPAEALCTLTVYMQRHGGDGVFCIGILGRDNELSAAKGRLYTLRGQDDSTIWQCVCDDGQQIFYFLAGDRPDRIFPIRDESDTVRHCPLESIR